MNFRVPKVNFSKGELAPALYARFDVDVWQSACRKARNVIILKYGGLTKRPGHRLVAEVLDDSEEQRLIPFEFSLEQTYALEFGQGYASPLALGGRVLETELDITAITAAANAQVTAIFHGYSAGDRVFIKGVEGEMGALLNNRFWDVVTDIDDDNFTINADTTGLTFTASAGGETRGAAPDPDPVITVPAPVSPPEEPDTGGGDGGSLDPTYSLPPGMEIP